MVDDRMERDDQALADELAARLDAGSLEPAEGDSPEIEALLATFARLQQSVEEPAPGLYERVRGVVWGQADGPERVGDVLPRRAKDGLFTLFLKRRLVPAFYALTIVLIAAGLAAVRWTDTALQRVDKQRTILVAPDHLAPGTDASLRVVVQDFSRQAPVEGALVRVSLAPEAGPSSLLFEGQTDETGSLPVQFAVPADAPSQARLVVETESAVGQDLLEREVTIERDYRLLLGSDKPLYQPGQTIHMRVLALGTLDLRPARGETVDFVVEDAKGNKVFRQSVVASEYGIAAADFTLADLVNQGDYKLSASIGQGDEATRSERTVEVRPYVLPKFGVEVSTDRSYYLPGQRVEGVVQAAYFFGKPVAGGQVQIVGTVWDVERTVLLDLRGQTDEDGSYAFRFDLPDYFAASGLDAQQSRFVLEITVVDQAEHAEQVSQVLPIAEQPLVIEAIPEGGKLRPGVENVVYVLTSYPDGRPAPARLEVRLRGDAPLEIHSGEFGLAEFTFLPGSDVRYYSLQIDARDEAGLTARRQWELETEEGMEQVLLRADRATYVVGETMQLVALTAVDGGSIYLDIVKGGQTLSTRSARVEGGRVDFAVDLSPDFYGTLELHAYKVLANGNLVRDTRLVVVDEAREIDVTVNADKETYLPGETATLDFQTTDARQPGLGVQSALGLAIVDESVFALERQDPGFARLYFMLEQELMEPFYQIKDFELPASLPPDEAPMRQAQDQAAKATWADVPVLMVANPLNSRAEKLAVATQEKGLAYQRIGQVALWGLIAVPPLMFLAVLVALWGVIRRSWGRMVAALIVLVAAGGAVGCLLAFIALTLYYAPGFEAFLYLLGLAVGIGMLAFTILAWARRDSLARVLAQFTLLWLASLFLVSKAAQEGWAPAIGLAVAAAVAYLLLPAAYLLFGQGRWVQARHFSGKLGTGLSALTGLPALLVLALLMGLLAGCGAMPEPQVIWGPQSEVAMSPTGAPPAEAGEQDASGAQDASNAEAPRLRQYFPETLYWAPEVVTDEGGFASLEVPLADSITTWRLTALASTQDGRLGFTTRGVRVFQDFFVDVDLPVALTQSDEIGIPVAVYNYLPQAQEVRLEVQEEEWFELLGEAEQVLTIAADDVEVVYFPIRVVDFGRQGFQVTAWGEKLSDAVRRQVNVVPNGKEMVQTESNWLREDKEVAVDIPAAAVPGASSIEVKIYPGVMAQAVEGLEKILRLPHG